MSYIIATGYGYSKRLCEDVTAWFLNKYFPRHKLNVEILHRGLRREQVYGYCDVVGDTYRPRHFLIEMNTYMPKELYIQTLLHELTHMKQWVVGSLRSKRGKMYYGKECVEDIDYWEQPHEVEARHMEEVLYHEYLVDKGIRTIEEVTHSFPNRLMIGV